jgi:hypothetical protein
VVRRCILRDAAGGRGEDVLPLAGQIKVVEDYWQQVEGMFSPESCIETHCLLKNLQNERVRRRLPRLFI